MITGTAVVVALGVGTAVVLTRVGAGPANATPQGPAPADTTAIVKTDLADRRTVTGKMGYGTETALPGHKQGTVTWLPTAGAVIERGGVVYKVDAKPVPLFYGDIPLYRPVGPGVDKGPDVKVIEENLKALGFGGFGTPDEKFTDSTATAIKKWQKSLGLAETGTVNMGDVVVTTGSFKVSSVTGTLGGPGAGDVLKYTGVNRAVTVQIKQDQRDLAQIGAKVSLTAGGKSTTGTISKITEVPPDSNPMPGQSSDSKFNVSIALDDPNAITAADSTSVDVKFTAASHSNVLAVPVGALLALAEGGYAVELADTHKLVPVTPGLFSDGKVEISGPDIREGMRVVTTS
ncbi:peptidoglycan hydrolase-like protein with peptidoglycan-binding domain [Actinocrispum wychmicini]|uniref:Peptidoglycan hydrolase-like protein with peptidoglycan-binding domain n=2 Tax=Actinocrispum wychmicini TaxID=1213861 RepID=A0A4R2JM31_9PSEU|nr:peptidoglycan hydrolase-like protein with peptidoglycan-binding domain [Actinocrispum wychmicini]